MIEPQYLELIFENVQFYIQINEFPLDSDLIKELLPILFE